LTAEEYREARTLAVKYGLNRLDESYTRRRI
jgi:hypothetical protein